MPAASGLPIRELQLATLVDEVPDGDEWLHEQKFDGYRILAHREGRRVTLLSRRWKDWTAELPTVAEAVAALPARRAILDGEVAVLMPGGSRTGFGALLVGYYDQGRLVYAGKVGTGYTERMLAELRARLDRLLQRTSPFQPEPPRAWTGPRRHWVKPELVGEVAFSEWTADGRLRHPSFQGLRLDKRPTDVVRERPADTAAISERAGSPRPGSGAPRSRRASRPGSRAAPRRPARGRTAG
jgi:ATP-dependent DNA ligase